MSFDETKYFFSSMLNYEIKQINIILKQLLSNSDQMYPYNSLRYPNDNAADIILNQKPIISYTNDFYTFGLEILIDRLHFALNIFLHHLDLLTPKLTKNVIKPNTLSFSSLVLAVWNRIQSVTDKMSQRSQLKDISKAKQNSFDDSYELSSCTQTETQCLAFCESCSFACEFMKHIIGEIEAYVVKCGLESEITQQRFLIQDNIYDISQWGAMKNWIDAISKDLTKLMQYFEKIQNKINIVEQGISEQKAEYNKLQGQYELLQNLHKKDEQRYAIIQEVRNNLQHEVYQLRDVNENLKNKLKDAGKINQNFQKMLRETEEKQSKEMNCLKSKYESEKEELIQKISSLNILISDQKDTEFQLKEQIKQLDVTISSINAKIRTSAIENEVLLNKKTEELLKMQENLEKMKNTYEQLSASKHSLEDDLNETKQKNANLEKTIHNLEKEVLLFKYTDACDQRKLKVCGNPVEDMKEQLKANEIHIEKLLNQNKTLKATIEKLTRFQKNT